MARAGDALLPKDEAAAATARDNDNIVYEGGDEVSSPGSFSFKTVFKAKIPMDGLKSA